MVEASSAPTRRTWWGQVPEFSHGAAASGFGAALWTWQEGTYETVDSVAADINTLSVCLDTLETEFSLDRRKTFSGEFRPGMLALIPADSRTWAVQRGHARKLHLYLPNRLIAEAAGDRRGAERAETAMINRSGVFSDARVSAICRRVMAELISARAGSRLLIDALGVELAVHAIRAWSQPRAGNTGLGGAGLSPQATALVVDFMQAHLAEDLTLDMLAAIVDRSSASFCRAFHRSVGVPPHRHLLKLRMDRARDLLRSSALPVAEVAALVGYDDPSYFSRLFKLQTGVTPSIYRQTH